MTGPSVSPIHQVMIEALQAARIKAVKPADDDAADYALVDVLIAELDAKGFSVAKKAGPGLPDRLAAHDASLKAALRTEPEDAELAQRVVNALTPSPETKLAYWGEFEFEVRWPGEAGDDERYMMCVPWSCIKAIMAGIRKHAGLEK